MDWLSEIEKDNETIRLTNPNLIIPEMEKEQMARVLREQSAVLIATNPWKVSIAVPNGYQCRYCRSFVRFTCTPKGFEFMEQHKEDCIWRNLSDDAKELCVAARESS